MRGLPYLLALLWAAPAPALELDCVARLACVTDMGPCQATEVAYSLKVGRREGDKVVLETQDEDPFYEFTRLPDAEGTLLQAAGGALDDGQGAGAMTVFDDFRFVLTRHSRIVLDAETGEAQVVAISILGACEEPEQ